MATAGGTHSIRIGNRSIDMLTATRWVTDYTDASANLLARNPFAYPAYDRYRVTDNHPAVLDDGDLLAPVLLNVKVSVRSFYALQRHRHELQQRLAAEELEKSLAELDDAEIATHIGGLFAILDGDDTAGTPTDTAVHGVRGTTLSKILHRKRPRSVPLHDAWVWTCYVGKGGHPVQDAPTRTWRTYMTLIASAMAQDLREQPTQFAQLQDASSAEPGLSDLRLLDILAWNAGQRPGITPAP